MGAKYSLISIFLGIAVIILSLRVFIGKADSKVIFPYMFAGLGILQLLCGYSSYKQGKKGIAIFSFLAGLFILLILVIVVLH